MPQQLLPQSALAVGQTPLAGIRAPQTGVGVPNPMDISNFYRMQQGQQNNAGLIMQNEQLKLKRQQMDLQNYATRVKEMEAITGMIDGAFKDNYKAYSNARKGANNSGLSGDLNPAYKEHHRLIRKNQDLISSAEQKSFQMGVEFLNSNSTNPAERAEAVRNITNTLNEAKTQLSSDREYAGQVMQSRNMNQLGAAMDKAIATGKNVNMEAYDRIVKKYEHYANTGEGYFSESDWNLNNFVFDGRGAMKRLNETAKTLSEGYEERVEVPTADGGVREGVQWTGYTHDEMTDKMTDYALSDPDIMAMYNNVARGRTMQYLDDKGNLQEREYSMRDWMGEMSAPFAAPDGKRQFVTKSGGFNVKPEGMRKKSTSPGGGEGSNTAGRPEGYSDVLGYVPKTETERLIDGTYRSIVDSGFVPPENMAPGNWKEVIKLMEKGEVEWKDVKDEEGNVIAKELWQKGDEDYEPSMRYRFGKRPEASGMSNVDRKKVMGDFNLPKFSASSKKDLGSRNNNPVNIIATANQKKAGRKVDDRGFLIFDSLYDGYQASFDDMKYKLDGKSSAMGGSAYMKSKYTDDQLKNYMDHATIEDITRIYTPSSSQAGGGGHLPNSEDEVSNMLTMLEGAGFPRDMKLKDLDDDGMHRYLLAKTSMESPHSYARLMDENSPDYFFKANQDVDLDTNDGSSVDDAAPKDIVVKLDPKGQAFNTVDRIMTGDYEGIDEESMNQMLEHPPKLYAAHVNRYKEIREDMNEGLDELEMYSAAFKEGKLNDEQTDKYMELSSKYGDSKGSSEAERFRNFMGSEITKAEKVEAVDQEFDSKVRNLPHGQSITASVQTEDGSQDVKITRIGSIKRKYYITDNDGVHMISNDEQLEKYMQGIELTDSYRNSVMSTEDLLKRHSDGAAARIKERGRAIKARKADLDEQQGVDDRMELEDKIKKQVKDSGTKSDNPFDQLLN